VYCFTDAVIDQTDADIHPLLDPALESDRYADADSHDYGDADGHSHGDSDPDPDSDTDVHRSTSGVRHHERRVDGYRLPPAAGWVAGCPSPFHGRVYDFRNAWHRDPSGRGRHIPDVTHHALRLGGRWRR
jgi:hypothetical protein